MEVTIEQIGPNLTREIYRDRIMILTISSLARSVIDQWLETTDAWYTKAERMTSMDEQFVLALQDFSPTDSAATPYSRSRAEALVNRHPTLRGRSAIVIAHALYVQMLTNNLIRGLEGNIERQIFHDRDEALRWLEELL